MSLHDDARAVLTSWAAPDPRQDELRRSYLHHLDTHPDAMWRDCRPGHLTASTAIIDASGHHVVLVLHRLMGMWLQTGGHCEAGDATLAAAALREAEEESGISGLRLLPVPVSLDRHEVPCGGGDGSLHLDVRFAAIAPEGAALVRSEAESDDLRWFSVDAVPEPTDDACRTLVGEAAAAVRRAG
ncbi:NUDIX domain-containing protein [Nocardiopsis mangrovi]|uniref:NUDIX domain-containing protein n=1 Tax=Nocardiopsis mangrovi TaxID=1179818 RepID=A0ABV9DNF4_9ACTN